MSVYDYTVKTADGSERSLREYEGDVVLIVNTATKCGLAPQFDGLEELYQTYKDRGFTVLGFPSNQFANQEPGSDDEVQQACRMNFGVTFPLMAKIDVNGKDEDPLYTFLKKEQGGFLGSAIKWNFTKFLVDREGNVVKRYDPRKDPKEIAGDIERLLEQPALSPR
ncbi:MAG TPA: glutathione peroxidase [Thermomicrobiales bacterium]|nr:glutathione peroxidase [Thermomicrobiales bacterium]